jgi:uncharacterized sulfatase
MNSKNPNIVFITTDTQGREMISSYVDRPGVDTPNIDRLAERGVLFENAFTACPLCTPARSAWFTGVHPNRNGAFANELSVHRDVPMLAEVLGKRGYRCSHIGKWHLDAAGYDGAGKADGGFDDTSWYDLTNFYTEVGRGGINRFGGWNRGLHEIEYCFAHRVADRAIELLKQTGSNPDRNHSGEPIFLTVSFDEPHGPYICPPPFRGRSRREEIYRPSTFMADMAGKPELQKRYSAYLTRQRKNVGELPDYYYRYYDCNSYVDFEIGRVIEAVDDHCPEDTVIIFTSDHGDHLGAFGLCAKGPTMYDHTIAVPLIMRAPGLSEHGRRIRTLVSSLDLWWTILDLADANTEHNCFTEDRGYTGRSMMPLMQSDGTPEASDGGTDALTRQEVFIEYNRFGVLHHQADGFFPIRCIRTADWKLSINLLDRDELYNMSEDPEETTNLIDNEEYREVRNGLHDRLLDWQVRTQDVFRSPRWAAREWRTDYKYSFEGFTTTGYRDRWEVDW